MKQVKILWDMPITLEIADKKVDMKDFKKVYEYFKYIDDTFSTFKKNSEISKINIGKIKKSDWSLDIKAVFELSEKTRNETNGYFNIFRNGKYDPLGIVKGWAVNNAAYMLKDCGYENFYIDAGGDAQVSGVNEKNKPWRVGIRNPFNRNENIKIVELKDMGIATSGTYIRGQHIQNPLSPEDEIKEIVSLTVVAENVYEADRFATAAFAMERKGIEFIDSQKFLEGYMVDRYGIATQTRGFEKYVYKNS